MSGNEEMGSKLIPSRVTPAETAPDDPRIGHLIRTDTMREARVVLIGFGSDEGVRRNGGRVGAADAPDLIRRALFKLTPDAGNTGAFVDVLRNTVDAGNVRITGDVEEDQATLGTVVAHWLEAGAIPIILGGGHETSYGHFLGYVGLEREVELFNVDAHADVRPLEDGAAHSGSSFFQAITHPSNLCRRYTVIGLQPWSVAASHKNFLETHGCRWLWKDDLSNEVVASLLASCDEPTLFSMDMDAVNQCEAPGVSAPAVNGIAVSEWLYWAYLSGRNHRVSSFDLVEVNPRVDVDGRTVRLAALTVWQFLQGISRRN